MRGGGGIARQIALLAEHHGEATAHRIARDARAIDAAANDEKIGHCRHGTRLSFKNQANSGAQHMISLAV